MDSGKGYVFTYEGQKGEALNEIKRYLVSAGWDVQNEDEEAGVMSATKNLTRTERVRTSDFAEGLTGTSSTGQVGKLSFALSTVSDSAGIGIIQMATEQGIKIAGVFDGSPADAASIEEGDLLVSANGTGIDESNYQDLSSILGDKAGTKDTLEISDPKSNSRQKVILKLGEVPPRTSIGMAGRFTRKMSQESGFTREESQEAFRAIRGHPMMVLHAQGLNQSTELTLRDPNPSELPRNKYSPGQQ